MHDSCALPSPAAAWFVPLPLLHIRTFATPSCNASPRHSHCTRARRAQATLCHPMQQPLWRCRWSRADSLSGPTQSRQVGDHKKSATRPCHVYNLTVNVAEADFLATLCRISFSAVLIPCSSVVVIPLPDQLEHSFSETSHHGR